MNFSISRRNALCAAAGVLLPSSHAWAFDRALSLTRFRQWMKRLETDLLLTEDKVPAKEAITPGHIDQWCTGSIVPGSRGSQNFAEFLNLLRQDDRSYWTRKGSALDLALHVLERSIPAGQGGTYPEEQGSPFAHPKLSVWYVHIDGGERLARHFANPDLFSPYQLPPAGEFKRRAYPFLLFDTQHQDIRFGSFGQEWWGVLKFIDGQRIA